MWPAELIQLGGYWATRIGLLGPDAEDCAVEFAERMFMLCGVSPSGIVPGTRGWFETCARNLAIDRIRALSRLRRDCGPWPQSSHPDMDEWEPVSSAPTPEEELQRGEFWLALDAALVRLTTDQRAAFEEHYIDGSSIEEIAAARGATTASIKTLLHRARHRLRMILGDLGT